MDPVTMIQVKRSNERPHTDEELGWWIREYTKGKVPDYQMSAWLMAVCWRGMDERETATLTRCMVESGERVDWNLNGIGLLLADKHSTGGVGDKISLILAPLAACLGAHVPMMAGRGLGHTGGTIDKLESIPGYQTSLSVAKFQSIVQSSIACSIVSPNETLCLADRKLYALRDVTATVSSIPLQTASIMSKKIAENPDALVLDVKYGKASFQDSVQQAEVLAQSMIATGIANGVRTTAFMTRMDHPIGYAVGNWLEVYECIQIMKTGKGAFDLIALAVVQTAQLVQSLYPELSWDEVVQKTLLTLQSGKVYDKFRDMVQAHGGNTTMIDACPPNKAAHTDDIVVPSSFSDGGGTSTSTSVVISNINALLVGQVCVKLGAGRTNADDAVDPAAGVWFHCKVGDQVGEGDKVATLYTNISDDTVRHQAVQMLTSAIEYSSSNLDTHPVLISHRVTSEGKTEEFSLPPALKQLQR